MNSWYVFYFGLKFSPANLGNIIYMPMKKAEFGRRIVWACPLPFFGQCAGQAFAYIFLVPPQDTDSIPNAKLHSDVALKLRKPGDFAEKGEA